MTAYETAAVRPAGRHRRAGDWTWGQPDRVAFSALRWVAVALAVFTVQAFVAGPVLVDLIGLWPTCGVAGALIAILMWRR